LGGQKLRIPNLGQNGEFRHLQMLRGEAGQCGTSATSGKTKGPEDFAGWWFGTFFIPHNFVWGSCF
jgi:hypothetical protein